MLYQIPFPRIVKAPAIRLFDLGASLIFLYFVTLHADQLNIVAGSFTLRLNNLFAFALFLIFFLRPEARILQIHRNLAFGIGAITCSLLISFLLSAHQTRCFFFFGWYGFILFCYVLLPYHFFRVLEYHYILRLYIASFVFVGAIAILQWTISLCGFHPPFASQIIKGTLVRPNAFAYEPSFYALYMTPLVIMAQLHYFLQKESDFFFFKKLTKTHLICIHFLFLISTATSTVFAYGIFLFVLGTFCITPWKRFFPPLGKTLVKCGIVLVFFLGAMWIVAPGIAKQFYLKFLIQDFRSHHSFFERWAGIVNAWKIFLEHPFFGVGLGGIPPHLYNAWGIGDTSYLFLFENQLADYARALKLFEPSNVFTEVLASLGILGFAAFGFFIFSYFNLVRKAIKTVDHDPFLRNWILILFISVSVSLLVLQFNQGLFRTYIWTHFAIAFAFTERALKPK